MRSASQPSRNSGRARRADAGTLRCSSRGVELLRITGEQYAVTLPQLARLMGRSHHAARWLRSRWERAGWAEVLDEQLASRQLVEGLRARGLDVATVGDLGVTGRADPDVVRTIDDRHSGPWVFVTMDVTIVEEHPGFDWDRYAIAWISVHEDLTGAAFEASKTDIVHRHAHQIVEQGRGDHHTYTTKQRIRSRPSLASQLRRKL